MAKEGRREGRNKGRKDETTILMEGRKDGRTHERKGRAYIQGRKDARTGRIGKIGRAG